MSLLVTQSLYGSIKFYQNAKGEWVEKSENDLRNMLARNYSDVMPAPVKRGIEFENTVYNILRVKKDLDKLKASPHFMAIVKACKGGTFQDKVKFFLTVDGEEHCMYGKTDVLLPDKIIDLKTTGKWTRWSEEKYYGSMQHHIYCYGYKIPLFEYHIAVIPEGQMQIDQYHVLPYEAMTWQEEEKYLIDRIAEIRKFMTTHPEFNELWRNTYSLS